MKTSKNILFLLLFCVLALSSYSQDNCQFYKLILDDFSSYEHKVYSPDDIYLAVSDTTVDFDSLPFEMFRPFYIFYIQDSSSIFRKGELNQWQDSFDIAIFSNSEFITPFKKINCLLKGDYYISKQINKFKKIENLASTEKAQTVEILFSDIIKNSEFAIGYVVMKYHYPDTSNIFTQHYLFQKQKQNNEGEDWKIIKQLTVQF